MPLALEIPLQEVWFSQESWESWVPYLPCLHLSLETWTLLQPYRRRKQLRQTDMFQIRIWAFFSRSKMQYVCNPVNSHVKSLEKPHQVTDSSKPTTQKQWSKSTHFTFGCFLWITFAFLLNFLGFSAQFPMYFLCISYALFCALFINSA